MSTDTYNIRVRVGGKFVDKIHKGRTIVIYEGGYTYLKCQVFQHEIKIGLIRDMAENAFKAGGLPLPERVRVWYRQYGKTLSQGRVWLCSDEVIAGWLQTVDKFGSLDCYVTAEESPPLLRDKTDRPTHMFRTKLPGFPEIIRDYHSRPNTINPHDESQPPINFPLTQGSQTNNVLPKSVSTEPRRSPRLLLATTQGEAVPISREEFEGFTPRSSPRVKSIARKGKKNLSTEKEKGNPQPKQPQHQEKVPVKPKPKPKPKPKAKKKLFVDDEVSGYSSSSGVSDIDIPWEPGEEEVQFNADEEDELFLHTKGRDASRNIFKEVECSLSAGKQKDDAAKDSQLDKDINQEVRIQEEIEGDSDELRSLDGSDDEVDKYPHFNAEVDFTKPIKLQLGLKFSGSSVLRKALRWHAIENRYDYYYLQNTSSRITTYCKQRCGCPWDAKKSKKKGCKCKSVVCNFKVHARKLATQETCQVRTLNVNHTCVSGTTNSKLSSELLGEKYIEEWRIEPTWKLKSFIRRVFLDLGIEITYTKAWLARARAKLIIYGNASEQYAKVWEYVKAIQRYNPGSSAVVAVEGIERPPPLFQRMYICLNACKEGFKRGCRPIIGVDGCHLKGAYPGQCLVAVGKDGNNNIYPFAWAVVEVENTASWCWFLELLSKDIGDGEQGQGWTFMSDRQKGLLDGFKVVFPKAELRFCVRHIWANFKLQLTGTVYKELFWGAARATTKYDFDMNMESIKALSEAAYDYLDQIHAKHWSRHAFSTDCKSNMLLNNMCETFNAVIKEARDKPILTQMEWMRRYMMKRNYEKWEGVQKYEGINMPYIEKTFQGMEVEARKCILQISRVDVYEVQHRGDQFVVDLGARTCTCYQWDLTGIPCVHGYRCIHDKRANPHEYVHEAYSRATYLLAYGPSIKPMPGVKHWEKVDLPRPLPLAIKTMPGRPKSKKRRKEKGEDDGKHPKRSKKTTKCSNCGKLGHNKKSCKNPTATEVQKGKVRRPPTTTNWAEAQRAKKSERLGRRYEASSSTHPPPNPTSSTVYSHQTVQQTPSSSTQVQSTVTSAPTTQGQGPLVPPKSRTELPTKSTTMKKKFA